MGNTPEAVEAFKAGALDMICTIEPYGTSLLNDVKGSVMLSDGIDIYCPSCISNATSRRSRSVSIGRSSASPTNSAVTRARDNGEETVVAMPIAQPLRGGPGYTDCVLAVRADLIKQNPAALKSLIKGMMKAQYMAETKPKDTLQLLVGPFYKTSLENARIAMSKQPSVVDARSQTQFILDRVESIAEMGYIKKKPGRDAIDWSLLEQVIAENQDLYGKLKYKSAA